MTRVDFYILPGNEPNGRQLLACRLADKAYQLGRKVYIHTDSHAQTEQVDKLLWTFRQNSFVPHAVMEQAGDEAPPVLLGNGSEPSGQTDVLINLANPVPKFFSQFDRVTEVIDQQPEQLKLGRERYRFYQDRGYELNTHRLEG